MEIKRSATVAYSAAEMFELVNDIGAYPQFVPWCDATNVYDRTPDEVKARLTFAFSGMHKSFTTRNLLQKDKIMEMRLIEGPFKHLQGIWQFQAIGDNKCTVKLALEFEFSSALVAMMFGPVFHQVANTLVDCFCKRAKQVYGQR